MMFTNKQLRQLIVPLIIEQLLSVTVGLADSVMVASVGEAAVSGVSLVDTIMVLIINIFAALATGGAVVAGHYIGQQRKEYACKATDQLMLFVTVLSIIVTVGVYAGQNLILHGIFGQIEEDVMKNARIYLLIVTASVPFIALYNGGAAIFRSVGNSKISMESSLLMNAVNITGNAILIYGCKMGVEGAAIPTLVSRMFAALIMIVLLRRENQPVHMSRKIQMHFDKHMIHKILHIGVPNGLENSMFQLGKILVLSLVATFGTASIAANAVSNTIAMFQTLPGMAMGFAILTVAAQCAGAGDYKQVRYYTKKLLVIEYIAMVAINVVVYLMLPVIIQVYHLQPETAAMTRQILTYHACCACTIWPMSFSLPNTLRAANDVKITMWISIFSMWIFRILFSYILGEYMSWGVFGIWVAMTIDWLFRAICFTIRYIRGKWQYQNI
ncbi:MATE family efflux transporter [Marvinbryantia formatexigens]|nr:MATE family efflux transporter [Marvinbryantia formatexigens]UWO26060.1 MATE family efflux transporter [Marvinbryantia formatexigens DSM 14469]SDF89553.1 putative efflux protein, MATE family [Marvinbryantia formatexigens]